MPRRGQGARGVSRVSALALSRDLAPDSLTILKREGAGMRALGGRAGGLLHARHVLERLAPVGRRLRLAQCRRLCAQQRAHADGATAGCVDEATAGGGHRQQPRGGPLRHPVAPRGVGACRRRLRRRRSACTSRRSPTIAADRCLRAPGRHADRGGGIRRRRHRLPGCLGSGRGQCRGAPRLRARCSA